MRVRSGQPCLLKSGIDDHGIPRVAVIHPKQQLIFVRFSFSNSSQTRKSVPAESRALRAVYAISPCDPASVRLALSAPRTAFISPDIVRAMVNGCVLGPSGRLLSVNPCSKPAGPFTYHSVREPRRYSTRFCCAIGTVDGTRRQRVAVAVGTQRNRPARPALANCYALSTELHREMLLEILHYKVAPGWF